MAIVTWAVLLAVGALGGAVIGIVYMLRRYVPPDAWVVIEDWDVHPAGMFAERGDALAYIANAKNMGNADAYAWVVRGVVLLREEGDPR